MSTTVYYSKELGRLLTPDEAQHTVRWHKKGCTSCKPIVVPTRPVNPLVNILQKD